METTVANGREYTIREIKTAERRLEQGDTLEQIAADTGRTPNGLGAALRRHLGRSARQIQEESRQALRARVVVLVEKEHMNIAQAARHLGIAHSTASLYLRQRGRPQRREIARGHAKLTLDQRVVALYDAGLRAPAIGSRVGRSQHTVRAILTKHGKNARREITEQEVDEAERLLKAGETGLAVAARLRCSERGIIKRVLARDGSRTLTEWRKKHAPATVYR